MTKKYGRVCQVCRHDERWRIELLKAGGASLDTLAAKFGIHRDAIWRHWRDHVSDEAKASYLAGPAQLEELGAKAAQAGMSVLDYLQLVRTTLLAHMAACTEAGDAKGATQVASQLIRVLEVIGRSAVSLVPWQRARPTTWSTTSPS